MATAVTPTGLSHIPDTHIDESAFNEHCVSWSVWFATIDACIDTAELSARVEVKINGVVIGKCVISPSHQNCKIGGSLMGFKAEAEFKLNGRCLEVGLELCAPVLGCKKYQHELFCF